MFLLIYILYTYLFAFSRRHKDRDTMSQEHQRAQIKFESHSSPTRWTVVPALEEQRQTLGVPRMISKDHFFQRTNNHLVMVNHVYSLMYSWFSLPSNHGR